MSISWSDVSKVVGSVAPTIGTLLGGPAGAAVGSLVSSALGVNNDQASVSAALQNDPDALVKIKELEVNAKVQLQQIAASAVHDQVLANQAAFQAEVDDRKSARDYASTQTRDWIRPAIAVILLAGSIGIAFSILTQRTELPDQLAITVGTVIGYWFSELKQVLAFYFGTTKTANESASTITQFAVKDGIVSSNPTKEQNK